MARLKLPPAQRRAHREMTTLTGAEHRLLSALTRERKSTRSDILRAAFREVHGAALIRPVRRRA